MQLTLGDFDEPQNASIQFVAGRALLFGRFGFADGGAVLGVEDEDVHFHNGLLFWKASGP